MKRWALLIVGLYLLTLVVLLAPGLLLAFGWDTQFWEAYKSIWVWVCLGVMVLGQALLLLVPVGMGAARPRARRGLTTAVVTSAFFMALLGFSALMCAFVAVVGDGASGPGPPVSTWIWPFNSDYAFLILAAGVILVQWIFWGVLFHQFRRLDEDRLFGRLLKWLLGGSVLELLVAVPSHIIVRQRGDCCAPAGTFFGMATGVAIMFMTFGPGVLWLYAKRMEALRGGYKFCRKCGYDLRATPERCPECGTVTNSK